MGRRVWRAGTAGRIPDAEHRRLPEGSGLLLFLVATISLNLTPGPDMLYVIARSVGHGRPAGIVSALGIAGGCLIHTLAVAFGLASLLVAVPAAFLAVKYAGGAYLVFLGIRVLAGRPRAAGTRTPLGPESLGAIFFQGVLTNVLNPKVVLFFLAFLPQFVDPAQGGVAAQLILLGILFNTSGTIVNLGVALAASYTGDRLRGALGASGAFRWLTGGICIGLGVRLALLRR